MRPTIVLSALVLIGLVLAGCTGRFEANQTEPLRLQVEGLEVDGPAKESRVEAAGDGGDARGAKKEFRIENTNTNVQEVTVVVEVKAVQVMTPPPEPSNGTGNETNATAPPVTIVLILVEDRDTGERLAERTVEVEEGDEVGQTAELNINVKGKDNVVVVTQAQQGSADVNVSARGGTAMQQDAGNMTGPSYP